jgi:metal-responsive CopG/Arc/MetJ family transcriptional regulator
MEDTDTSRFSLILDKALREQVDAAARLSDRSAGGFIRTCVRAQLQQQRDEHADRD